MDKLLVGDWLGGRYQCQERLGGGDMALTYKALDNQSGAPVILKVLNPGYLKDWKVYELFEREAKALKHLDHPQIPQIIDFFQAEDGWMYVVTHLIEGKNLEQKLELGWQPNELEVKQIMQQLLAILIYLHQFNPPYIHRDIKPSNLILDASNQLHLIDFGAVQATLQPEGSSTIVGTFGFMAPEQFQGKPVAASDLYSAGVTAIYLLYGRDITFLINDALSLNFRPHLNVSAAFADWLEKMCDPEIKQRFSSAKLALEALNSPVNEPTKSTSHLQPSSSGTSVKRFPDRLEIQTQTSLKSFIMGLVGLGIFSFQALIQNMVLFAFWKHGFLIAFLFLSPFYLILFSLLYFSLRFIGTKSTIILGKKEYTIRHRLLGIIQWTIKGKTEDILSCKYEGSDFQNRGSWVKQIEIQEGVYKRYQIGLGVESQEIQWIYNEINRFLLTKNAKSG